VDMIHLSQRKPNYGSELKVNLSTCYQVCLNLAFVDVVEDCVVKKLHAVRMKEVYA